MINEDLPTESVDDSCRDDLSVPLTGDGGLGAAIECKEPKDEYEGSQADQRDGVSQHLRLALCDDEKYYCLVSSLPCQ